MAEKRMFTQKIIDSDAFLEMPLSAQALYFHLNMRADDDGFVNNPKRITKLVNASEDDLKILLLKRFIIGFASGVIVIKHWRMHNTLKSDRYHPTDYQEEFAQLGIKPNKAYTDHLEKQLPPESPPVEPERNQDGTNLEPQIREDLDEVLDEEKNNGTLSDESVCRPQDVRRVFDAWQSLGIQKLRKIPDTDTTVGKMLRARIKDYGIDSVLEAVEIVRKSDFLMGKVKDFQITLDWFVRPNNFLNIVNGKYDNRTGREADTRHGREMKETYNTIERWAEEHANDGERV